MQTLKANQQPYSAHALDVAPSASDSKRAPRGVLAVVARHFADPLHRSTYLLTANLGVTLVSGILFWIIASRMLTPAQVGTATAFIAPTTFLTMAFLLGANHGVLRFSREIEKDPRLLFALMWISAAVSGLGGLIGAALLTLSGLVRSIDGSIWLAMCLYALLVAAGTIWTVCEAAFIALRAPGKMLVRNLGLGFVRVGILLPFIGLGEWGLVAAFTAGMLVASGLSVYLIARHTGSGWAEIATVKHPALSGMMRFSLPNHAVNLLASVPLVALPLIAFNVLGAEISGYFYVAWTISSVLRSVLTAGSATLLAEGARDHSRIGEGMGRSILFLAGAVGAASLPMIVLPQLFLFPFGASYVATNTSALPLFAMSMLPAVLTTVFVARERVRRRVRNTMLLSGATGALSVGMPCIGALTGGYQGFAAWYLMSQIIVGMAVVPSLLKPPLHERAVKGEAGGTPCRGARGVPVSLFYGPFKQKSRRRTKDEGR